MVIALLAVAALALYGLLRNGHLGYGSAIVAALFGFLLACTPIREPALDALRALINAIPNL
ncbi:hypothetical protein [Streptomyces sp. WAC06614]|uniref:hypothetical protein n=1 Tax=Streptomyces sp. WAC06614 TaxID=2487416 RepID=UPI000F78837F|nr:hypothetical protein [Streptomyces sp. WAC06614]RSS79497.1 hypothetical protein EF918_17195 [Streptomyces sp. WAC06614]